MSAIIDFFSSIANGISAAFDFLIGIIQDLVYIVKLTAKFLVSIPSYFSWLPGEVFSILAVILSVVVIYKILGREG